MPRKTKSTRYKSLLRLPVLAGLIIAIALATYLYHRWRSPNVTKTPSATIHSLPARPMANNGEKNPQAKTSNADGAATDTNGSASSTTSISQWTVSQSGQLTVKQPSKNTVLKNGDSLIGSTSAAVSQVQYRLIDDVTGVLAQGALSVSNGNFSGSLNFQPGSSSGRLDVFTTDGNGGPEQNEVQIPLSFR